MSQEQKDSYQTIANEPTGEFKDRGSKFIAYAFSVATEEDWQARLEEVKKLHNKARHHCYAYRLGLDKYNFRANDDGEPSGSAGRPILGQIDSFGLSNVFVVVVRYFGGTKLGVPGLINAYKTAAQIALSDAEVIEKVVEDTFRLTFDYAIMSQVMNAVKSLNLSILKQDFGNIGIIDIGIRKSETEETLLKLRAKIAQVPIEMAMDMKEIEGLKISVNSEQ